ncbi:MAG: xanthine dehydrogenase family protein subunit M [Chloroflexi bacterium]|nr:xanthine dehydrogenase family protein subunit M [Chloroflexota bacterium]MCI0795162.1 xanthine dehydrogenase family protein subunit M [Chloroflexota bacterium]MCI0895847.1 xanthine dehydrogenase family protein subunit M [Chloroflexota bacterium]
MIDFEFHTPSSLEEAFALLERHGDDARVMAGGTALILQMKQRFAQPGHVISLRGIPGLSSIEAVANGGTNAVRVGALCTQRQVETSPVIQETVPLVAETFRRVATPRIRNMGTIGGGLVHGDPNQDPPPSLIALGASVELTSSAGQRVVPVEDLFIDYYETDVQPGEIMTSILIPAAPAGSGSVYLKFLPRTADDYGTVSAAAVVSVDENNTCQDIRLVLGGVGMTPIRATEAEDLLRGRPLTEDNIRASVASVKDAVDPLEDFRGSPDYKREMAEVFARRAINQAVAAIPKG